ncbi:hypothetical protein J8281_04435 [Aquimarina sp. U1-2]|uniref:hypothetical protein n=1 Tax=Aquimarina sp. U1-2 TaxID=2823141 RepID=UPI001AEC967C|nr:hypothetical protein [Aquimarina sp. U1-2]MBP2831428.1 hypothetical protein [Aquimarina sp. U1-2]
MYGKTLLKQVKAEDITITVSQFQPLIGNAKPEQSAINAAKSSIDEHIKQGKYLLTAIIDKLMIRYQFTDISFYNEYQQSRTIVDV